MKKNEMFSAIGNIDNRFLDEATSYDPKKHRRAKLLHILIPVAAAMALLTVTLSVAIPHITSPLPTDDNRVPPLSPELLDEPILGIYNDLAYIQYKDHIEINNYFGENNTVEIPSSINGLPVTDATLNGGQNAEKPTFTTVTVKSRFLSSLILPKDSRIVLHIADTVNKIAPAVFRNDGIVAFTADAGNSYYSSYKGILYNKEQTVLIACPEGFSGKYLRSENFRIYSKDQTVPIPKTVQRIEENAFANVKDLRSVEFNTTLSSVGKNAFGNCQSLRSATFNATDISIAENAFSNCEELKYFSCALNEKDVKLSLPEDTKVLYNLTGNADAAQYEEAVRLFCEAEEVASLFTRYHMIDCDPGTVKNGCFYVTDPRATDIKALQDWLIRYFDRDLADRIFTLDDEWAETYYTEIDGELYVRLKRVPLEYDADRELRSYAVNVEEDGTFVLTVRTRVPDIDIALYSETEYCLKQNEEGKLCFTKSFPLPVEPLYRLYLMETLDRE